MKTFNTRLSIRTILTWFVFAFTVSCSDNKDPKPTLIDIVDEAPGTNCVNGGQKISVGTDSNGNGSLDPDEKTSTKYVCNNLILTLTILSDEAPGSNCAVGGQKVQVGLDKNGNFLLDATEVQSTKYNCYATTYEYPQNDIFGDNILAKDKLTFPSSASNTISVSFAAKIPPNGNLKIVIKSKSGTLWYYSHPATNWSFVNFNPSDLTQVIESQTGGLPGQTYPLGYCIARMYFDPGQFIVEYYEANSVTPTFTKTITVN